MAKLETLCELCPLYSTARQVVWGEGPTPARIMVVGEAPGEREDWSGHPFFGPSGIRLNVLLSLLGVAREDVYVTNVVKHRPPKNATPKAAYQHACKPYLVQEILSVQPELILCMGGTAIKTIIGDVSVTQEHGFPRRVRIPYISETTPALERAALGRGPVKSSPVSHYSVVAVPMFHPAFTLRNPDLWPVLAEDFLRLPTRLGQVDTDPDVRPDYTFVTGQRHVPPYSTIGFDVETTSPKRAGRFMVHEADIVGYSTATTPFRASYFPGTPRREPIGARLALEDERVRVVCHNTKFEYVQLARLGITLTSWEDTKLAASLLGYESTHLKHLTRQVLGEEPITYSQATGGKDMGELDPRDVAEYGAADSDHTLRLWHIFERELDAWGLRQLYEEVEKPLIAVLARMEMRGIQLDRPAAYRAAAYFDKLADKAEQACIEAGFPTELNLRSRDQLAYWLEENKAPITERTEAKQQFKTDNETMLGLGRTGWMPDFVTAYADFVEKTKLASFPKLWLKLADPDGVLHPSFSQAGHYEETSEKAGAAPVSGRLACLNPNIQQIPHHGRGKPVEYEEYGAILRRCFVARPGYKYVAWDISQQEPRVTAIVAPEPAMLTTFEQGVPVYSPMAEVIYNREIDKRVDLREWHTTKTFFLASVYGCEWTKLVEIDPDMDTQQARVASKMFADKYKGLARYGKRVALELQDYGYVRDYFGRVRWFPGWYSPRNSDREAALREAINTKIQGPGATITKIILNRFDEAMEGLDAHLIMTVHDEIIAEIAEQDVPEALIRAETLGDNIMPIEMPLEAQVGDNLGDITEPDD